MLPATAFKIGGTAPLTGEAAIYGNAVARTAPQLAAEEINAEGADIQIELKFEDDETQHREGCQCVQQRSRTEGIQLSLGAVTSKPGRGDRDRCHEDRSHLSR